MHEVDQTGMQSTCLAEVCTRSPSVKIEILNKIQLLSGRKSPGAINCIEGNQLNHRIRNQYRVRRISP